MPEDHIVSEGECISSIADQHGFFPDTVWDDPANAELKNNREHPNILSPGDTVVIPDLRLKEVSCATDRTHRFMRKGVPAKLRLQLFQDDQPRAQQEYTLDIDGRIVREGKTDDEGVLEESIPPSAMKAHLTIGPDEHELDIALGCLSPIAEIEGVQDRLNNLGYHCGPPTRELDDQTRASLRTFQEDFELPVTGEADDATRDKLMEVHDQPNEFPEEGNPSASSSKERS